MNKAKHLAIDRDVMLLFRAQNLPLESMNYEFETKLRASFLTVKSNHNTAAQ